jgi:hypothetical protein
LTFATITALVLAGASGALLPARRAMKVIRWRHCVGEKWIRPQRKAAQVMGERGNQTKPLRIICATFGLNLQDFSRQKQNPVNG